MPLCNMAELAAARSAKGRIMGLDLGTKTIGLAVSDAALMIASPITTIARTGFESDMRQLRQEMEGRDIEALILGLPMNMDGSEGPRAEATRKFADRLAGEIDLPIAFWDERLSTRAVERAMIDADLSRGKRAKKVDSAAAAYILQGAIDFLRSGGGMSGGL